MAGNSNLDSHSSRLDSWKEIAVHLNRSVRTVQRWEEDLGLPIHRLEGKKRDIVYAFKEELDAWLAEHSHQLEKELSSGSETREHSQTGSVLDSPQSGQAAETHVVAIDDKSAVRRKRPSLTLVGSALVIITVAALLGFQFRGKASREPYRFEVRGNQLVVLSDSGVELWRRSYPFPLESGTGTRYPFATPEAVRSQFINLDGDPKKELLIVTVPEKRGEFARLDCFDHDGKLLWERMQTAGMQYGQGEMSPPYSVVFFQVFNSGPDASPHIWMVSNHVGQFASVVTKLDTQGNALAEFWHPGHISVLAFATVAGKRVVLVGGTNNEFISGALAVLDYDQPQGFAPATHTDYQCLGCPTGNPLAYIVFARSEVSRTLDTRPRSLQIFPRDTGWLDIVVDSGILDTKQEAGENYSITPGFELSSAELTQTSVDTHQMLRMAGLLKHPLDRKKAAERLLAGFRYWDGKKFSRVNPSILVPDTKTMARLAKPKCLLAEMKCPD